MRGCATRWSVLLEVGLRDGGTMNVGISKVRGIIVRMRKDV